MPTTRRVIDHRLTVKAATAAIGGSLGYPSKMPGTSYGLPTSVCHVGRKLRDVAGSTCEKCYAHDRNNYKYESVKISQANRLASLSDWQAWVDGMTYLLNREHGVYVAKASELGDGTGWHRWHDSGDLIDEQHISAIVAVCERTPHVRHWLPTREVGLLSRWLKTRGADMASMYSVLPDNLTVRVSATMVDGAPSAVAPNVSTVHRDTVPDAADICPAPSQGNACGSCRRCWSRDARNTSYHVH